MDVKEPRHGDKAYSLRPYGRPEEWTHRAEELRLRILAAAGIWPLPPKVPLKPFIDLAVEGEGYVCYKVTFESVSGFWVTGNLYCPGPFCTLQPGSAPAVLCPHGHWERGRLAQCPDASHPARCVDLARMGYIAFSWDMVGYLDSYQLPHGFGTREDALMGITPFGLQLWNGIRAVDFLVSLPAVDSSRIGCTGESGGGTQTFYLTAVDERIRVSVPVNMVSAHFQGGCKCENAPGLRLDTFNVETAAMCAPRPLLLISATGDWTLNTPSVEYPMVKSIYDLYGSSDKVAWVQMDAPHNYNKDSREAMCAWFARWFGLGCNAHLYAKSAYEGIRTRVGTEGWQGTDGEFRHRFHEETEVFDESVFRLYTGDEIPNGRLTGDDLLRSMGDAKLDRLRDLMNNSDPCVLRGIWEPAVLAMAGIDREWRKHNVIVSSATAADGSSPEQISGFGEPLNIADQTTGAVYEGVLFRKGTLASVVILIQSRQDQIPVSLIEQFTDRNAGLLLLWLPARPWLTSAAPGFHRQDASTDGKRPDPWLPDEMTDAVPFYTTYNPTGDSLRLAGILAGIHAAGLLEGFDRTGGTQIPISLMGLGHSGLLTIVAAALAADIVNKVVADLGGYPEGAMKLLESRCCIPGLLGFGGIDAALRICPSGSMKLLNGGHSPWGGLLGRTEIPCETLKDFTKVDWLFS